LSRKLTQRGRDRRRQIIDEATRLFAERGFHPTSVSDIVTSLGVGKGVFYWYFSSKEELLVQLLEASQLDLRRRQQTEIGDEADPVRRIEVGIRASMQWFSEHRDELTLFQFAATEERFAPVLRARQDVAIDDLARHLKDAIGCGRAADQDAQVVAYAILGVVQQLARTFLFSRDEPVDRVADAAVAFCLRGLEG
jgi:AcrR family transcriptional regulator